MIIEIGRGDQTAPNVATTSFVRAGDLADRVLMYRNDLARAQHPDINIIDKSPHGFLLRLIADSTLIRRGYALQAQNQIAAFFASDGATLLDPDGVEPIFEVPVLQLPGDNGYLP